MKLAVITPTKDRPQDVRVMLDSLAAQTVKPHQVIIVDASTTPLTGLAVEYPQLKLTCHRFRGQPSAAAQRNAGLALLDDEIELVCFFDDDQTLSPDALAVMLAFWQNEKDKAVNGKTLGGAAFNQSNNTDTRSQTFKKSALAHKLGLYAAKPGGVAPSGWQSLIGTPNENMDVEWFGAGYCVMARQVLDEFRFDPFFTGYSYLEDLDFSYGISRKYRLVIIAAAHFAHYHASGGRPDLTSFGEMEVVNRRYFVKKHGLSLGAYRLMMLARFGLTCFNSLKDKRQLKRAWGNILGVFRN